MLNIIETTELISNFQKKKKNCFVNVNQYKSFNVTNNDAYRTYKQRKM